VDTGLINERKQALGFVKADALQEGVDIVLWAQSPSDVYTFDAAFEGCRANYVGADVLYWVAGFVRLGGFF
jgi:hypothetical protein